VNGIPAPIPAATRDSVLFQIPARLPAPVPLEAGNRATVERNGVTAGPIRFYVDPRRVGISRSRSGLWTSMCGTRTTRSTRVNPAPVGSVIRMYVVGAVTPRMRVEVDYTPAEVLWVAQAPDHAPGIFEVRVRVP
jgi:hypothetical protein